MSKPGLTNYQKRATKMVTIWRLYSLGTLAYLVAGFFSVVPKPAPGTLYVWLTGWVILYSIAAMSDAVYDSLMERLNYQSDWLRYRLDAIEFNQTAPNKRWSGQRRWLEQGTPYERIDVYFDIEEAPEYFTKQDRESWVSWVSEEDSADKGLSDSKS